MAKKKLCHTAKGFVRSIGWEFVGEQCGGLYPTDGSVKYKQHKFYLGHDRAKAELASLRLEQLWGQVEACHQAQAVMTLDLGDGPAFASKPERPIWDELTLAIAKAVAKGATAFHVPCQPHQNDYDYAQWLTSLQKAFPVISLVPEQQEAHATGRRQAVQRAEVLRSIARDIEVSAGGGQTLHQALDEYAEALKQFETESGWGRIQVNQTKRLKDRHPDVSLSQLDLAAVEKMVNFWRLRPPAKDTGKPISPLTARNQIKQLKDFFKWLHRQERYGWRKPEGYEDINCKVQRTGADTAARMTTIHVPTFGVDDLRVLYQHATPLMRTLLLLGLNCGFAAAESGSLRLNEIFLGQRHPHADTLGIESTSNDSWVRRLRVKTGVYGEFKLWPETVEYVHWALERRRRIGTKEDLLLVSERGMPLNSPTASGNKSSRIPNLWKNLHRTVQKHHEGFKFLPFKFLRKTAGELVRRLSDGEVAGVFLCHGTPVRADALADVYTNRPFKKVHDALDRVRAYLAPVFAE
jgi:hypothetical protein